MMIKVNLLPAEYRKKDRTPLRVFGALIGGVLAICATGYYYVELRFGQLSAVETEVAGVQNELSGLEPQVRHHDSLVKEKADYMTREQTIHQIQASRISWTRNVDRLIDLVNSGESRDEDARGYLVWLSQLSISQNLMAGSGGRGRNQAAANGGGVTTNGYCAAQHFASVTQFFDDLKGDEEFFTDFATLNDPKGSVTETNENLEPSRVWTFPIELKVNAPTSRAKKGARKAK